MKGPPEEPLRSDVLASFDDGVFAVAAISSHIEDWSAATPCPDWSAKELAGHLLSIARYYHRLLEAASAGDPFSGLPRGDDLAEMNATDLARLTDTPAAERISEFVDLARSYGARLAEIGDAGWSLILGTWMGLGPLTVGQHAGIAIGEWHVHAWDLARACGLDHRPADPGVVAAGQRIVGRVPADDARDPWMLVLAGYERVSDSDA